MEGVDYSFSRPNLDQLKKAGKKFVFRYLAYLPNRKVLSKSELRDLHAHGFGVGFNWEQAAGDMKGGFDKGVVHAREALRQANSLGLPADRPIYFSADWDVRPGEYETVGAYLDGVATVLGRNRVGLYGHHNIIEYAHRTGKAKWLWQTYAWSGGRISPNAHLRQYRNGVQLAGADVDLDIAYKSDIGAWFPETPGGVDELSGTWDEIPKDASLTRDQMLLLVANKLIEGEERERKLVEAVEELKNRPAISVDTKTLVTELKPVIAEIVHQVLDEAKLKVQLPEE